MSEQTSLGRADPSEKTGSERAYHLLRNDIVSGAIAPNTKLKIEMLRSRYDIGAAPLREALARLAGEHLVYQIGQRGFLVSPMSLEDANQIGHMRRMLEIEALSHSIPAGDEAWEERIITAYHRLERAERKAGMTDESVTEWERLNHVFHEELVSACASVWLLRMRAMMFQHHERYRRLSRSKTVLTRDIGKEHRGLLDAALDRDTNRACAIIGSHIDRTTAAVQAALETDMT